MRLVGRRDHCTMSSMRSIRSGPLMSLETSDQHAEASITRTSGETEFEIIILYQITFEISDIGDDHQAD